MKRLFLGNFDFEHTLLASGGSRPAQPAAIVRLQHELAAIWPAITEDGDLVRLPAPVELGFFDNLAAAGLPKIQPILAPESIDHDVEAYPWGWTDEIRSLCEHYGWKYAAPPQEVIREVNSRRFAMELEQSWGIGLEGASIIHHPEQLRTALEVISNYSDRWVLKAEFGMSGRERILGSGRAVPQPTWNWLSKRLDAGEVAVVEPWVDRIEEAGLQYTIPWSGVPLFEGVAQLLCDENGQYCGSRFDQDVETELRWMPAIETGMRVARLLKQMGYFGPLGLDAMRYRDADGNERLRSVQDINARHSMGRLALGLRRILESGEQGTWLHVRWPTDDIDAPRRCFDEFCRNVDENTRVIRTSPFVVDDQPVGHGTLVVATRV